MISMVHCGSWTTTALVLAVAAATVAASCVGGAQGSTAADAVSATATANVSVVYRYNLTYAASLNRVDGTGAQSISGMRGLTVGRWWRWRWRRERLRACTRCARYAAAHGGARACVHGVGFEHTLTVGALSGLVNRHQPRLFVYWSVSATTVQTNRCGARSVSENK